MFYANSDHLSKYSKKNRKRDFLVFTVCGRLLSQKGRQESCFLYTKLRLEYLMLIKSYIFCEIMSTENHVIMHMSHDENNE